MHRILLVLVVSVVVKKKKILAGEIDLGCHPQQALCQKMAIYTFLDLGFFVVFRQIIYFKKTFVLRKKGKEKACFCNPPPKLPLLSDTVQCTVLLLIQHTKQKYLCLLMATLPSE